MPHALEEVRPEAFEFGVPEGVVRVEVGYPDIIGETTVAGPMVAKRVRYADVFLNGQPVRDERRAVELLSRAAGR